MVMGAHCNKEGRVPACPQRSPQQETGATEELSSRNPRSSSDYVYETQK